MRPLAGIVVLDCSRVLAGPYCAMLLGDLGADVIKIEQPGKGDETRSWGPPFVGCESPYFWTANRNKRSVTLDLSRDEGRAILKCLLSRADVLIENYKVGTLDRWGFGDQALQAINGRLVHTAITAYGPDGPRAHEPGYDVLLQAEAGWMSITGEPDGTPVKAGMALVDVLTAMYAVTATLGALRVAEQTGRGQRVDCSLLRSAVAGLVNVGNGFLATGRDPQRWGNAHATIVPYQLFYGSDQPFVLAVGNDAQWRRCCEAIGRTEWGSDPRFATNPQRVAQRAALIPLLRDHFATQPADHWLRLLGEAQVPAGPVNTLRDVFSNPQVDQQGIVGAVDHSVAGEINLLNPPFAFTSSPVDVRLPPPLLGQHTDDVLCEVGFTPEEVAAWRDAGIV